MAVQNKKDDFPERYQPAYQVAAEENIEFYHVSARRGDGINVLRAAIHENAQQLLDYGMPMPRSWVTVRQFFLENLQKEEQERLRLDFKSGIFKALQRRLRCHGIVPPSLLTLLHSNGILYYNEQFLEDTIIADQRWALDAIYKPLDRKSDFYDRLRNDTYGKVRVKHIFREFGTTYTEQDKWLFLHFMRSCGLCFPMKQESRDEKETEESYYIFPEFLPKDMSDSAKLLWEDKPRQVCYFLKTYAYLNYYKIQSFIAKLGQKTRMEYIWRNGILIHTTEGDFKVFTKNKALVIAIDETAIPKWLNEIISEWEEEEMDDITDGWQTSENGIDYQPCDLQAIRNRYAHGFGKSEMYEAMVGKKTLSERLPDVLSSRPLRLVASYASQDRDAVVAMYKQLKPLKEAGKLEFWYDQKLDGRESWDDEINEQFEEADGYITFVSSDYTDFENKRYIHEKEIPIMQRRHGELKIPVYCVTVRPVDFGPKLAKSIFFNDKNRYPVKTWSETLF
ncbi:MAG: hypothetical protein IPM82_29500 [Saprospiraceae bacterium]|nr:hypothetical protein [Saprospiraceae bacterium]